PPAAALAPATGPSAPAPSPATASAGGTPGFVLTLVRTGPSEVRLNWPPLHGIGSYAVYQAQGDTPLSFAFTTGTPGTTLTGLAPGTSYTFQVRARDAAGREVATSNTVTLQLGPG
ncbi:MAG TPA: fibronectin type III domain-containing protein, partial [Chloroflexota bacterium]|nr:fibronectin type III domain-containing protein [Chloroflexota bacterium]